MKNGKCNLNSKQWLLLVLNAVLVIAFLVVSLFARNTVKDLYSQREAERWEEEGNSYAQVSAFASPERGLQVEDVTNIRSSLLETLSKDALNEAKGNARVWIDAYSGECKAEVRKDNNTLSVTAVGVGGDFFQFHPVPLLSGGYISSDDLNHDRIVVDEGLAWALFGSNDIVGMQVWMGDNIYVIAGVISVDENALYKTAYGSGNRIYMSYDQLKKQQDNLKITCYEAVLPNPISNYAYYALRQACGLEEEEGDSVNREENPMNFDNIEVIENSNRYEIMALLGKAKSLKLRSMRTNSIAYPYWENVARVIEEEQIMFLIIKIILLIFPCICLICLLYRLWKNKSWTAKDIVVWLLEKIREKREAEEEEARLEMPAEEILQTENPEAETDESTEEEVISRTEPLPGEYVEMEEQTENALRSVTSEDIFQVK